MSYITELAGTIMQDQHIWRYVMDEMDKGRIFKRYQRAKTKNLFYHLDNAKTFSPSPFQLDVVVNL